MTHTLYPIPLSPRDRVLLLRCIRKYRDAAVSGDPYVPGLGDPGLLVGDGGACCLCSEHGGSETGSTCGDCPINRYAIASGGLTKEQVEFGEEGCLGTPWYGPDATIRTLASDLARMRHLYLDYTDILDMFRKRCTEMADYMWRIVEGADNE